MTAVLIHGFGTSARLWDGVLPLLEGPALTPDLPGFGGNVQDDRYSVDGMADAVLKGVMATGAQDFLLVGHSMGAKVAAVLASRRPPGLSGLLLVAPSPPSPEPMTPDERAALKATHRNPRALEAHYRQISVAGLSEVAVRQLIEDGCRASRAAWNAWPDAGSREHREGEMPQIEVPILVLTSAQDLVITPQVVDEQIRPAFPHATYREAQGSGHLLPLELPVEVARAIRELMSSGFS